MQSSERQIYVTVEMGGIADVWNSTVAFFFWGGGVTLNKVLDYGIYYCLKIL